MLRLDGIQFVGEEGRATYTVASYARNTSVRREGIPRPYSAGSFPTPGFQDEQEFVWSGLILTDHESEQQNAILRLASLLSSGGESRLVVDLDEPRWADVHRVDIPAPRVLVPGRVASYQVTVGSFDPFLYGETREFSAGDPAIHRGTHPAFPVFVVTGTSAGGYTITGPGGQRIVVTTPLVAGTPHTINTDEGEVTVGGALGNISVFEPWTIGPGIPGVTHAISAGSLLVKVTDKFS